MACGTYPLRVIYGEVRSMHGGVETRILAMSRLGTQPSAAAIRCLSRRSSKRSCVLALRVCTNTSCRAPDSFHSAHRLYACPERRGAPAQWEWEASILALEWIGRVRVRWVATLAPAGLRKRSHTPTLWVAATWLHGQLAVYMLP